MRPRPLAFRPPHLVLDAELEWVLRRAFGPRAWSPSGPSSGPKRAEIALRLDVASRIASRHGGELLEQELGAMAAHRLREQYVGTVARGALLDHALSQLLARASAMDIPCVLLKYAALNRMGVLRVGARVASDVDLLVPRARARQFQAQLLEYGYRDTGLSESSHQLPALQDPNGVLIELHVHVPFVTLAPGLPFVSADDLFAAGLTVQSDSALLPHPAIVAAHAVAHGLVQHAYAPHMYSPLKLFADINDLEQAQPGLLARAGAYLSSMAPDDITSVRVSALALSAGDLETAMIGGPGAILRHAIASQLDRRYAIRLRIGGMIRRKPSSARRSPAELYRALRAAWHWARSKPSNLR